MCFALVKEQLMKNLPFGRLGIIIRIIYRA